MIEALSNPDISAFILVVVLYCLVRILIGVVLSLHTSEPVVPALDERDASEDTMSFMSLMDSVATILRPAVTRDPVKGTIQTYAIVTQAIPCSVQQAGASVVEKYAQRQTSVSTTLYFITDPGIHVNDVIDALETRTGRVRRYIVRGESQPVARGRAYQVDAEYIDAPS